MLDFLLNLIYPNVCGFCGNINEDSLCKECEENINKHLVYNVQNINGKYFDKLIYLAHYDGEFRDYILSFKFLDKPYIYKSFSKLIIKNKKIYNIIR